MTVTKTILRLVGIAGFLLAAQSVLAQEMVVKGKVVDSLENLALDSCHITIKNSSGQWNGLTNGKGFFSIKTDAGSDSLLLIVNRKGFQPFTKKLMLKPGVHDVGTLILSPLSRVLEDIVITARTPAIVNRNDTTEYTIDSFDRKRNATIGDVLKDLPGFDIDAEGNITHNGKKVTRILVNGEDFFGGNRSITLNNLPADLIAKLQVMDTKTKEEIFNGLQGDGEDKTINIKLKKGLQAFGNTTASAGTLGQRSGNLMGNLLKDQRQIGVIASTNMSTRNAFKSSNRLKTSMNNGGLHYRNKFNKKLSVNGSMTTNGNSSEQESIRRLQLIDHDSIFVTNSQSYNQYKSQTYQGNVTVDFENKQFMGSFSLLYAGSTNNSTYDYSSDMTRDSMLINKSQRIGNTDGTNQNISANLSLNKRFRKKGRSASLSLRSAYGNNNNDNLNYSNTAFFTNGSFIREDVLRQHVLMKGLNQSTGATLSYIEPLSKKLRLQLNQSLDFNSSENDRRTFNIDSFTKEDVFDSAYSNRWTSNFVRSNTSVLLILELKDLYLAGGMVALRNSAERNMENQDVIQQHQSSYSPSMNANYKISSTKSLRFNFSSNWQNPTIDQLQPVPDNTNSLYVRLGNPNLKPAFMQTYNLAYNGTYEKGKVTSVSLSYAPVSNSIVNGGYYDALRRRISQYINVSGVYNLRGNWNFSKVLNGPSKSGQSFGMNGNAGFGKGVFFDNAGMVYTRTYNIRQNINFSTLFINGKKRRRINSSLGVYYNRVISPSDTAAINSMNLNLQPKIDFNFTIRDVIEITTTYTAAVNQLQYNSKNNRIQYTDHTASGNIDYDISKRLSVQSSFNYRYNGRLPKGTANREQLLWNASISMSVFKSQRGNLILSGIDLLNNGADVTRNIGDNFIDDVQTARQRSYFTLGFQYNWVKAAKTEKRK